MVPMEIVSERTHRVLAYVEAMNRHGVRPHAADVNAFAISPDHERVDVGIGATMASLAEMYDILGPKYEVENFTDYLHRIGLTTNVHRIELTKGGLALLQTLNTPVTEDGARDVVEIVLDPSNPYAYAQALSVLSKVPNAMLVEPYFRLEQLVDISGFESIERVLVGPGLSPRDVELLAFGLPSTGRPIEIRQAKSLHDRYLISTDTDEGVLMLGVSLGGIGKKVSTLTTLGPAVSKAIRELHQSIWDDSDVIEPKAAPIKPATPVRPTS